MPSVIYRGPYDRYEIDDLVLDRDGDAVELNDEQLARAQASPEARFEMEETAPTAQTTPPATGAPVRAPNAPEKDGE